VNPIAIHAFNPGPMTGAGNWTWLLRGNVTTLVDAGTGEPRFLDALDEALAGAALEQVIVTHGHVDHASGAPALARRHPGVRFLKMPWPDRDQRYPVEWQPLAHDQLIDAGDGRLLVLHTPGHAPDHVCLWDASGAQMFCGDLAMDSGSIYIPSAIKGGDLRAYLRSLEQVISMRPRRLLPAHGAIVESPEPLLRGFISHREERERQVLSSLRDGLTSADAIVARIYPGVRPAMAAFARDTVVSHLEKLDTDGRVRRAGGAAAADDAWHIIEP
jgi:glyoxylase-like metal-dependent hydrolase (beta-lactamase superfamily II)